MDWKTGSFKAMKFLELKKLKWNQMQEGTKGK